MLMIQRQQALVLNLILNICNEFAIENNILFKVFMCFKYFSKENESGVFKLGG